MPNHNPVVNFHKGDGKTFLSSEGLKLLYAQPVSVIKEAVQTSDDLLATLRVVIADKKLKNRYGVRAKLEQALS